MAARTSSGIGVGITITLLGVLSLTLFITTIVFLSKFQAADRNLKQATADTEAFVKQSERNRDDVQRIKDAAQRDGRKSVIGYLADNVRETMRQITGSTTDTFETMREKVDKIPGASGTALIQVIRDRDSEISRLKTEVAQAEAGRTTANENLANETERSNQLTIAHGKTIEALNADIGRYKAEIDSYREDVNKTKESMDARVGTIQQRADADRATLNNQIADLTRRLATAMGTIDELRRGAKGNLLRPTDEYALVDGTVLSVNTSENQVFIGLGEADKVILGMTFGVYSDGRAIRPDATGAYPRPKATLEVTSVGPGSSTARVLGETRGDPIVKGDVIANPVYDPKKVYKFVVFGNFDANADGRVTELEAQDIRDLIVGWGGAAVDTLEGDVDFLLLGERPQLPPAPGPNTPVEVVKEYQRLEAKAAQYDKLLADATATSVPVLNENRLYTLLGRRGGR